MLGLTALKSILHKITTPSVSNKEGLSRKAGNGFYDNPFNNYSGGGSGGYEGGKTNRLTEDWRPGASGGNRLFSQDGKVLRNRARDLYRNNPIAASAVSAIIENVIECGIKPKRNTQENFKKEWNRWGGLTPHSTRECDLTRDETIDELMSSWLSEVIVAGGCLIHYLSTPVKRVGITGLQPQRIPLTLELIPEEQFVDHLDRVPGNSKTANVIRNGCEIDQATKRVLAYWVNKTIQNDDIFDYDNPVRISRTNCEYGFLKPRFQRGSNRGFTAFAPVIQWLWALGYYTDNELYASDIKSSWAYMIATDPNYDDGNWTMPNDTSPASGTTDIYGNTIDKHTRGMVWRGYPGDSITAVGPNVPGSDSQPWIKLIENGISIGLGLSHYSVMRDFETSNFSSVRAAINGDKKLYRKLQKFTINHCGNPTLNRFDRAAVSAGIEGYPSPLNFANEGIDELWNDTSWQTPGWESVNPKDDAEADDIKLKNKSITYDEVMGNRGRDWEDDFTQREVEESKLPMTREDDLKNKESDAKVKAANNPKPVAPNNA